MPKRSSLPPASQQSIVWAIECSKIAATHLWVAADSLQKTEPRKHRYPILRAAELHLNTASHRLAGTKLNRWPTGYGCPEHATWQFHLLRAQYYTQLAELHAGNALKNKSLKPDVRRRLQSLHGAIRLANLNQCVQIWVGPQHRASYRRFISRQISRIQTLALKAHRNRTLRDWQIYARDLTMAGL